MSSILDAANASPDKLIIGELPTNKGDVSIMTLRQLYVALGGSISSHGSKYDPTHGYNSSTYYVYGITGFNGNNSTPDNLQAVGLSWYKQKNISTAQDLTLTSNGQTLFGGPLARIEHNGDNVYSFTWYYCEDDNGYPSRNGYYWNTWVPGFIHVAVVRATDAIMSEDDPLPITSSLPSRSGDISIMTIEQAYIALSYLTNSRVTYYDPTKGYNTSTYFIYAINDTVGYDDSRDNSTSSNLQGIGIDWYTKLNKPTAVGDCWVVGSHNIFGGPLKGVRRLSSNAYCFYWYYADGDDCDDKSIDKYYWNKETRSSVYVAIVHR